MEELAAAGARPAAAGGGATGMSMPMPLEPDLGTTDDPPFRTPDPTEPGQA